MPVPIEQLLLFLPGSILVNIVPGPDMALVMRQVFLGGTGLAQRTILGNMTGIVVHATALAIGLSALLVASAEAYTVIKLAGAAYLIYLGIQTLRAARHPELEAEDEAVAARARPVPSMRAAYVQVLVSTVLNPKPALLFLTPSVSVSRSSAANGRMSTRRNATDIGASHRAEGVDVLGRNPLVGVFVAAVLVGGCMSGPSPSATASVAPTAAPASTVQPSPSPSPSADPASGRAACTPKDHPEWSIARRWDEALLDAIRRALPNPPVHARNLFHLSVAMWDAWATYDPTASGYISTAKVAAGNVEQARVQAISYAAWAVLRSRFQNASGSDDSLAEFDDILTSLCFQPWTAVAATGNNPDAVGIRIARAVLGYGLTDGSNEAGGYTSLGYEPVNLPLVVASSKRFQLDSVSNWQPLEIVGGFSQNGIPTGTVQVAVAPHWGHVAAFGTTSLAAETPIDPGPPPILGDPGSDAALKAMVVEVIRDSSLLDPARGNAIDISPATRGNNPLGSNDGKGYTVNPSSTSQYTPEVVNEADFMRVAAEFWADGPRSETPPGHWNVIANDASDSIDGSSADLRIGGKGPVVNRLEWDVKLYLALNASVHNAAIVAWGLKGKYDSIRPISLIRYMGGLGQSSKPTGRSYSKNGLPLVPDLIEVITTASSAKGERHHALAGFVGRVAIRAWAGTPADPSTETAGTRWMLATAWVPYQLPTFVTPSFPAYVSGHSTFSRAAAEVLTAFTGSAYFPGGLASYMTDAGGLTFEHGPTTPVALEWATYYDAADQAGQSRLFGGIHIQADDFTGRKLGSQCGIAAWQLAQEYFAGDVNASDQACISKN